MLSAALLRFRAEFLGSMGISLEDVSRIDCIRNPSAAFDAVKTQHTECC